MSYSSERIKRTRNLMEKQDLDALFVRDLSNIKWLSNFDGVFDDEPAHSVLITPDRIVLHTDSRYEEAVKSAAAQSEITVDVTRKTHAEFLVGALSASDPTQKSEGQSTQSNSSEDLLSSNRIKIGIESSISLAEFRHMETILTEMHSTFLLVETSGLVLGIRAIKDTEEIRRMKYAQSITDAAFAFIVSFIAPNMTERDVQIALEDYLIRNGAQGLAFSSIVATGSNGASPHAIPGETVLEAGQSLVLDFGARAQGYCSDMTRTLFIGKPEARLRQAYGVIREANETVARLLEPGVTGAQAQEVAESILASGGFAGLMGHSLGHGVGIDVHEQPVLAPRNDKPLEAGNVVTVEPGIYVGGKFGMRLEDFGVITEHGFEVFTQSSHDMVII